MATAAKRFGKHKDVEQVQICSPDKDLAQCVSGTKIVGFDRFKGVALDEEGVVAKFGVSPDSIADLLALVGDTADGIPGIPKWGMKSASQILAIYKTIEKIPRDCRQWKVKLRGAQALCESLEARRKEAALFRKLA